MGVEGTRYELGEGAETSVSSSGTSQPRGAGQCPRAGVLSLRGLTPHGLGWSSCNNDKIMWTINPMHYSHPQNVAHPRPWKTCLPQKLVPGTKKAGGRCLTALIMNPSLETQPAHVGQELHVKSNQGDCLLK